MFNNYQGYIDHKNSYDFVFYVHVPKAAGTTLTTCLAKNFKKRHNLQVKNLDVAVKRLIRKKNDQKWDFIHGHVRHNHIDDILKANFHVLPITFIRHPIERLISDYRYSISSAHPTSQEFFREYPSFEEYIIKFPKNVASLFLVGKVSSLDEYIEKMKNFFFVGITSLLNFSYRVLCNAFDFPFEPLHKSNVTLNEKHNKVILDDNLLNLIYEKHNLDILFYLYMQELYCKLLDRDILQDSHQISKLLK